MIDKNDPRLTAFVMGELSSADEQLIRDAVGDSPELQQTVAEIQSTMDMVKAAFASELPEASAVRKSELRKSDAKTSLDPNHASTIRWVAACSIAFLTAAVAILLINATHHDNLQDGFSFYSEAAELENHQGKLISGIDLVGGANTISKLDLDAPTNSNSSGSGYFEYVESEESDVSSERMRGHSIRTDSWSLPAEQIAENALGGKWQDTGIPTIGGYVPPEQARAFVDLTLDLPSVADWAGKGELRKKNAEFNLTESLSLHDRRTEEPITESGRKANPIDIRLSEAIILRGSLEDVDSVEKLVESLTGTGREATRPSAEGIIPNLLKRVPPTGSNEITIRPKSSKDDFGGPPAIVLPNAPISKLKANFDMDRQLVQAKMQLEVAQQRFGPKHPNIKSLEAQVAAIQKFMESDKWKNRPNKIEKPRSWRRVNAIDNTTRLIVGDKDELDLNGMQVQVQVDGFRARVLVDYFYYNDRNRQLEGNFKIRLPDDSSLYYFAFGQSAYDFSPDGPIAKSEFIDGDQYVSLLPSEIGRARQETWENVKEARMVPREKAAFAYSQTVRRKVDPALVEWSGAGVFNARVFPLIPKKLHRIVIGYDVSLTPTDDGGFYTFDLPEQRGQCKVDVSVADYQGGSWKLELLNAANDKNDQSDDASEKATSWETNNAIGEGRSQKKISFDQPTWDKLRISATNPKPVMLTSTHSDKLPLFATRVRAQLPAEARSGTDRAVFLVDTSLSSRPDKFNVWLQLLEATLNNNRDELKRFAVVFFDVDARFWRSEFTDNSEENVQQLIKDCYQLGLEGATNLHGAFRELVEAEWLVSDDSQPDLFLLSDGAANWGETNLRLIEDECSQAGLGSLFAYQTGLTGTAISNLRFLSNATGGAVFSVTSADQVEQASTAHRNRPWRLNSIEIEGTNDLMTAGRAQWVYPGQWLTIVGRGKPTGDIRLNLQQSEKLESVSIAVPNTLVSDMASRLYGQVAVGQLESLGSGLFDLAAAYARDFRITGQTCSLLMLESEADYRRFDIKPQEDLFVVQSKAASKAIANILEQQQELLNDPKALLLAWVERMESMPGLEFTMPTALKIALEEMEVEAIDGRLNCSLFEKDNYSKDYATTLSSGNPNPTVVAAEAESRRSKSKSKPGSLDDALRAYSNLLEANPGDWVVIRDVAMTAMEWERPAAAYHLLLRTMQKRPYQAATYSALGQCLSQLGKADMALIFYELALGAKFQNQGPDYRKIVATEYGSLLRNIVSKELDSNAVEFANARLGTLKQHSVPEESDLVVTMMWNTDQTDVDLHVVEPSGEECSYQNASTKSGGRITADIRTGFGPEMYVLPTAPNGNYQIKAKFYSSNQSRTAVSNKVYLSIYRNYGRSNQTIQRETVTLKTVGEKELVQELQLNQN